VPDALSLAAVLAAAQSLLGTPYQLGGLRAHPTQPTLGLDCSEFVAWCYQKIGIALPWNAQQQADATQTIAESQAQPGDLVIFEGTDPSNLTQRITHIGIYLGGGRMINAQDQGVTIADIRSGYWRSHLAGFRRVTGSAGVTTGRPATPNGPPATGGGGPDFGSLFPAGVWTRAAAVSIGAALLIGGLTLAFLSSDAGQAAIRGTVKAAKVAAVA
jgi:hypothetical protein